MTGLKMIIKEEKFRKKPNPWSNNRFALKKHYQ